MKLLKNNRLIILVFFFLLIIKFYYLYLAYKSNSYNIEFIYNNGDAGHYYKIAENIFKFNVYSDDGSKIPTQSATWRPPFWPFVLSLFFNISKNPLIIITCKSIIEISLMIFTLLLYKRKSKIESYYFLPFLLLFIEPQYLKYSVTFLSESISAVLIFLLCVLFIVGNSNKKYALVIAILSATIILCHPVSVFFVIVLFGIYLLSIIKSNLKITLFSGLLFAILALAWPLRNLNTFHQGFYLTASEGATFSKGWNETVLNQFTNVDGDLADESLNLKYLNKKQLIPNKTVLENSKLYKMATWKFINTLGTGEKFKLAFKKVKSNFIPYPEKPKSTFIENIAIIFRILYLLVFLQMIYRFVKGNFSFQLQKDRVFMVVFAIFSGQIAMSIYIYTGLRFNSVFGLTLLFCFIYLNSAYILNSKLFKNKLK
jgi:hypothetical protein